MPKFDMSEFENEDKFVSQKKRKKVFGPCCECGSKVSLSDSLSSKPCNNCQTFYNTHGYWPRESNL